METLEEASIMSGRYPIPVLSFIVPQKFAYCNSISVVHTQCKVDLISHVLYLYSAAYKTVSGVNGPLVILDDVKVS